MKKTFRILEIDCANCAAKIEAGIQKIDGVNAASLNFFAQKLIIDADETRFDAIMAEALKVARKVERHCEIIAL